MMRGPRRRRRQTAVSPYEQKANRFSATGWLFIGLLLGLMGGLYYSWVISPLVIIDAAPSQFSPEFKTIYIEQISQGYVAMGDWERTEQRLASLNDPEIANTVATLLDEAIRNQKPDKTIRGLAALAQQLGVQDQTVALFAPTPATAVPTLTATPPPNSTPTPTFTPSPTATNTAVPTAVPSVTAVPTVTPQPNFRLLDQQPVCGEALPQIGVTVLDALLDPQPGVEVIVDWADGEDRFFTGFKPEQGLGYGDFTMTPNVSYSIYLAGGSPEISGLRAETCEDGTLGGWTLTFQNLRLTIGD